MSAKSISFVITTNLLSAVFVASAAMESIISRSKSFDGSILFVSSGFTSDIGASGIGISSGKFIIDSSCINCSSCTFLSVLSTATCWSCTDFLLSVMTSCGGRGGEISSNIDCGTDCVISPGCEPASSNSMCMPSLANSSACSTGSSTIIWVSPLLCAVNFDFFSTPPWLSLPSPSSGFFSPGKIMFKASSRSFGRGPLVGAGPSVIGTRGRNSGCLTTGFSIRLLLFERERVRVRERDTRRRERSCSSSFFSLSLITGCTVFHCCIILSSSWPCFSSSFGLTAAVLSCATVHLLRRTCAATGAAGCVGSCLIFIEGGSAVTRIEAAGLGLSNSLTSTVGRCFFLTGSSSSVVEEDESLVHEELETLPEDFLRLHSTYCVIGVLEYAMGNLRLLSYLNAMAYQYFRDPCAPGNANDRDNRVQFSEIYRMFDTNAFRDHRRPISFCLFFMDSMTLFFKRSAELSSSSSSSSSAVTPDAAALALFAALRPGFLSSSFSVVELDEDVEVVSLSVEVSSDDDDDVKGFLLRGFEGVTLRGSCCFTSMGGKMTFLLTASFGKVSSSSASSSLSRFSSPIIPVFCAAHNGALLNPASQNLPNSNASNSAPGGPGGKAFALPKRLSDGCCNIKSSSMLLFVANELKLAD
uniref:Uncharacterized protein n=1 Tax=Glossina palpalis gambiensis TaxID=67801 RepID=A0A1B0B777_9MUSC